MNDFIPGFSQCFYDVSKTCTSKVDIGCVCLHDIGLSRFTRCIARSAVDAAKSWDQLTRDCEAATGSRMPWSEYLFYDEILRARKDIGQK